jgi:endo-1,4-beta-xylanase
MTNDPGAIRISSNGRIGAGQATEFGFRATGTSGTMTPTCSAV